MSFITTYIYKLSTVFINRFPIIPTENKVGEK